MDMRDNAVKVRHIIATNFGASSVTDEQLFVEDLDADSIDTIELVMAFEEEFGIEIADDEAEKTLSVGDAVALVTKKTYGG